MKCIDRYTDQCVCVCVSFTAEAVVAESVVVIKKLLQMQPKENKDLIAQVARLADRVQVTSLLFLFSFSPACTNWPVLVAMECQEGGND